MEKQNFYDLSFDRLKIFLIEKADVPEKQAKMRGEQMFNAVYKKNIKTFDELTTFGLELREKIKNLISLEKPKIVDPLISPLCDEVKSLGSIHSVNEILLISN